MYFNKKVIQRAMPIYIGYLFLGLACGILGQQAHIAPIEAFIMSILAYSGSGQFICIAMMLDQASLFSILVTNFMVSLRYMFFSTAMYPHIKNCSLPYSILFGQNITDETFAVNLDSFERDKEWDVHQGLALGFSPCLVWASANFIGCTAAAWLNPPTELVSYILVAMFLGIWSGYLHDTALLIAGILGGILSVVLSFYVPFKLHIVLATLIVSAAACWYEVKLSAEQKAKAAEKEAR
ncbi:MAG: AzlC family ABC transporter permease [Acidaminococcaceae bacterium]|nr:AzlC family ABC transporter permease [Acidaminococcaceae bacterium]MBQ9319716.1 AzlC family ABC transporter permease [Acidaminococcaceae bacterium]